MYIHCKKDFNKHNFGFIAGVNYPICNILKDSVLFVYPNGQARFIHKNILRDNEDYIELSRKRLCKHEETIPAYQFNICKKCDEIVSYRRG